MDGWFKKIRTAELANCTKSKLNRGPNYTQLSSYIASNAYKTYVALLTILAVVLLLDFGMIKMNCCSLLGLGPPQKLPLYHPIAEGSRFLFFHIRQYWWDAGFRGSSPVYPVPPTLTRGTLRAAMLSTPFLVKLPL